MGEIEKNPNMDHPAEQIQSEEVTALERLADSHAEVQRRLIQHDTDPEGLLDNKQLKTLKLSPDDEIEYRRIRSQLLESSGQEIERGTSSEMKEFVEDKMEAAFKESCEPLFEEYHKFCVASGTNPSLAEWFQVIDKGGFILGDHNIGLEKYIPKPTTLSKVFQKPGFLQKIRLTFKKLYSNESHNDEQSDSASLYVRESEFLQKLKDEIFEIEYFQHTGNWKEVLDDVARYNDEFIDQLVSI